MSEGFRKKQFSPAPRGRGRQRALVEAAAVHRELHRETSLRLKQGLCS